MSGVVVKRIPKGYKPKGGKVAPMSLYVVACPDCPSGIGELCLSTTDKRRPIHPSRRRIAMRKLREESSSTTI